MTGRWRSGGALFSGVLLTSAGACTLLIGGDHDYHSEANGGAGGSAHASSASTSSTSHGSGGSATSGASSTSSSSGGAGGAATCAGAPASKVCGIGMTCDGHGSCQTIIPCGNTAGLQPNAVWPMFGYCPTHPGRSPYAGPSSGVVKWKAADPNVGDVQPAIGADGTLYLGGYSSVWALDPADGTTKWTYPVSDQAVWSTPAIGADGTIYVGTNGAEGFLALTPGGQKVWSYTGAGAVSSSPLIGPDGNVYFGSSVTDLYALTAGGNLLWHLPTSGPVLLSPALGLDGMQIYVGSGLMVYGVNPSDTFDASPVTVTTSPVVAAAGVYVGTTLGGVYELARDLTRTWMDSITQNQPTIDVTPAIGPDGTIYVGGQTPGLTALTPAGGVMWTFPTNGWTGPPTVDVNGIIYFGTRYPDSTVYALAPDGTMKWSVSFAQDGSYDLRVAPVIGADGTLYIGANSNSNDDPMLYAIGL